MALPEGTRVGARPRLSSARVLLADLAATAVWLLDVDESPLVMKTAAEMHMTVHPSHQRPRMPSATTPTPQAREAHELSPANSLLSMVTRRLDAPHLTAHAERPRAAVCVQHLRGSEPSESWETRRGSADGIRDAASRPAGCLPAGRGIGGGLGCAGARPWLFGGDASLRR